MSEVEALTRTILGRLTPPYADGTSVLAWREGVVAAVREIYFTIDDPNPPSDQAMAEMMAWFKGVRPATRAEGQR